MVMIANGLGFPVGAVGRGRQVLHAGRTRHICATRWPLYLSTAQIESGLNPQASASTHFGSSNRAGASQCCPAATPPRSPGRLRTITRWGPGNAQPDPQAAQRPNGNRADSRSLPKVNAAYLTHETGGRASDCIAQFSRRWRDSHLTERGKPAGATTSPAGREIERTCMPRR